MVRKDVAMKTFTDGLCAPHPARVMKKFALALVGIVAALNQVASGQSPISRIAYDSCSIRRTTR
jgi:hypothetical protein